MSLTLRVLTGARAGDEQVLEKSIVVVGRHPMCDFRFDADRDRDVSTRHAEIRAQGDGWILRDLGSTNGTFVDGTRLAAEHALRAGQTLSFGEYGPRVQVTALTPYAAAGGAGGGVQRSPAPQQVPAQPGLAAAAVAGAAGAGAAPAEDPASTYNRLRKTVPSHERPAERVLKGGRRPTTGERVAAAVRESTRGLRLLAGATFVLLLVAVGAAFWMSRRGDAARREEILALMERNDSLTAEFDRQMAAVSGTMAGLDSARAAARLENDSLRARLARAKSPEEIAALQSELARIQSRRERIISVGQLDNTRIAESNGPAVALLAVRMPDGTQFTGTAFGVTPRGLLVTNRHLVRDAGTGAPAAQMLAKFNGSRQWIPAQLVRTLDDDDLALIQLEGDGPYPAVAGIATTPIAVGAATLLMGFPLGMETAMEGRGSDDFVASASLGTATVSKVLADVLQLDAYAGEGSSGSPVFDRNGRVTGVVYGGARESGGRIVYAVPAARLVAALGSDAGR